MTWAELRRHILAIEDQKRTADWPCSKCDAPINDRLAADIAADRTEHEQ